jgi:hypothetical protein
VLYCGASAGRKNPDFSPMTAQQMSVSIANSIIQGVAVLPLDDSGMLI